MGASQIYQCGPMPTLHLQNVEGNLTLNGWDRPEVQVRVSGDMDELTVEQNDTTFTISSESDLWVQAPVQSSITIDTVDGNASISLVLNSLVIDKIEGNAAIHSVNAVTANEIEGNLTARLIAGNVHIDTIEGNAQLARVAGDVRLPEVDGNLVLNEIGGSIEANAEGNVKVQTLLAPGQQCSIEAEGSIHCEIPRDAGGVFLLKADGHIRVRELGEERSIRSGVLSFEREPANARLTLEADGNIMLRGAQLRPFDGAEFAGTLDEEMALRSAEIAQQITSQMESQVNELSRQLDDKLSRIGSNEELATSIQERVQAAMRRAEEKLADAMRKLEQRTQEQEGRRRKSSGWNAPPAPPTPPAAPKPKRSPATDEERMMILRMVEQGKISVDQAEKLLTAMSGGKVER